MKPFAKPLAALAILSLALPSVASAVQGTDYYLNPSTGNVEVSNFNINTSSLNSTQAGMYVNGKSFSGSSQNIGGALGQASGQCAFNSQLSELLSSFISYLLEGLFSDAVTETPLNLMKVPVNDSISAAQGKVQRAKEVCAWAPYGYCILPSLDSIAFCFVNQVIDYIGKATVQWIKTGFQGSPAFIDDPSKFFSNAVDQAAGNLLNQISDGLLCEPWRAQIQVKLLNEHTSTFQNNAKCSLSQISDKWEDFANGKSFDWNLQYSYYSSPYNNPLGSLNQTRTALNTQLAATQNGLMVETGFTGGYLNVKDPETGRITTPGRVIESQLNRRLGNAENRLLVADEFDEIINSLVNELVKLALSEVFDSGDDSTSEDGGLEYSYDTTDSSDDSSDSGDTSDDTGTDSGTGTTASDLGVTCAVSSADVNEGANVTATATVTGWVGTIYFHWVGNVSQASSGRSSVGTYNYANSGNYNPEIVVSDDDVDGEVETVTCPTVHVHEDFAVTCGVSATSVPRDTAVLYTANVVGADAGIQTYSWSGSASGARATTTETYGSTGTYRAYVDVSDGEGSHQRATCPVVTVSSAATAAPQITSISPSSGATGTVVTLTGSNFAADSRVIIDGSATGGASGGPVTISAARTQLTFQFPSTHVFDPICDTYPRCNAPDVQPWPIELGSHTVQVTNSAGTSGTRTFTVTN